MTITALPSLSRTDPTFKADVDTFFGTDLPQFSIESEAARVEINVNTSTATTQANVATTQASLATTQAQAAAGSALVAGAVVWVSGTTYAVGDARYSPINLQTYRRKVAGAGTTDPSLDAVNWAIVSPQVLPDQTGNSGKFLTTNGTAESWGAVPAAALTLLATLTPTVAANVDFLTAFSSTYDNYLIVVQGVLPSATDALRMRFAVAGSVDSSSNYFTGVDGLAATAGNTLGVTGNALSTTTGAGSLVQIQNANDAVNIKIGSIASASHSAVTPAVNMLAKTFGYIAVNAISGFRLYWNSGSNFQAIGIVRVYGYSNT